MKGKKITIDEKLSCILELICKKENFNVANKWEGMEKHKQILESYIKNQANQAV